MILSLSYYYLKLHFPNDYIIFQQISGPWINALLHEHNYVINSSVTQEGTKGREKGIARTLNPTNNYAIPLASTYRPIPRFDAHVNTRNYFGKDKRDIRVARQVRTNVNELTKLRGWIWWLHIKSMTLSPVTTTTKRRRAPMYGNCSCSLSALTYERNLTSSRVGLWRNFETKLLPRLAISAALNSYNRGLKFKGM